MKKYKFVSLLVMFIVLGMSISYSVFAADSASTTAESDNPTAALVSVGISPERDDSTAEVAVVATADSDQTEATTSDGRLALIAGAIGVSIPWESVGVLGVILLAILLGLWGVYRKENVRDWHH